MGVASVPRWRRGRRSITAVLAAGLGTLLALPGAALAFDPEVASPGRASVFSDIPFPDALVRGAGASSGLHLGVSVGVAAPRVPSYRHWLLMAELQAEPESRRERLLRWLPTVVLAATLATLELAVDPATDARWTGANAFDDAFRNALRAATPDGRNASATASHVLLGSLGGLLLGDWVWLRHEYSLLPSVKKDAEWFMGGLIATRATKLASARQRPYVRPCAIDPLYVSDCLDRSEHDTSFFSGHAATGATLAGLICSRHLHRAERTVRDALVCGGAASLSVAAGLLRISADRHYATDVIVGWASGALFGYFLPSRFTYGHWRWGSLAVQSIAPSVSPRFAGLHFSFQF